MNSIGLGLCVLVSSMWAPTIASADRTGVPVADIVAAMQEYGVRAQVGKDGQGDPQIDSALAGANFQVHFYDCEASRCQSIQFLSGFDLDEGMSLEDVNDWNRKMRYGSVYLDDEGDPYLQMDIDVTRGISKEQFSEWMAVWEEVVGRFVQHIDADEEDEPPETEKMRSS